MNAAAQTKTTTKKHADTIMGMPLAHRTKRIEALLASLHMLSQRLEELIARKTPAPMPRIVIRQG